jgi:hypothetical protein
MAKITFGRINELEPQFLVTFYFWFIHPNFVAAVDRLAKYDPRSFALTK